MNKININFENCYGIKKLDFCFDFSENRTYIVYAPNGFMKTSFAKTFMDFTKKTDSRDLIYINRVTKRNILDENNNQLNNEQVFVIEPYNERYKSQKTSTLLVNKELKEKYDQILSSIDEKKNVLLKELKTLSGLKTNVEETFSEDIMNYSQKEFFKAILRVKQEVSEVGEKNFASVKYFEIFNEKVISFLETADFKEKIKEYIETYDDLIDKSTYFKKGVFNHNNASVIAKNLKENGFFLAKHSVVFNSGSCKKELLSETELENLIEEEKASILNNPDLVKAFEELDLKLLKNKELRDFRDYLLENKFLLPELSNLKKLKNDLWISYLKEKIDMYNSLEAECSKGKKEIESIMEQANEEETEWLNVINIFNERFDVPFKIKVENQVDVILKQQAPNFKFVFSEKAEDPIPVEENELFKVLSNGEKRALYILNLIFEIEARKRGGQITLFVIDDIADSFDYKNKYAIIEYLKDIGDNQKFRQIILTHNFDFFRTVQSRIIGNADQRENSFIAQRNDGEIILSSAGSKNITNPFGIWKENLDNLVMFIATIPFVRNLVEFRDANSDNLKKLTSLLHIKDDTETITISEITAIYQDTLKNVNLSHYNSDKKIVELIFEACEMIYNDSNEESLNLENKIALSIGIRLKAEMLMWSKVTNKSPIHSNQTGKLFERYKTEFSEDLNEYSNIKLCAMVNLMTPENIHLNSFMYEPILDMSNQHLKNLYTQMKSAI